MNRIQFIDTDIIRMRKEYRKEKCTYDFENEQIPVGDNLFGFAYQEIADVGFHIMLPETFIDMPDEAVKRRYSAVNRPDIIKTSPDNMVNLTFSVLPETSKNAKICLQEIKEGLSEIHVDMVFYSGDVIKTEESEIHWMEFKSFARLDEIYNIMCVFSFGDRLIMGTFNCVFIEYEDWKPTVLAMLKTIGTRKEQKGVSE